MKDYRNSQNYPGSRKRISTIPAPGLANLTDMLGASLSPSPTIHLASLILPSLLPGSPHSSMMTLNDIIDRISLVRGGECRIMLDAAETLPVITEHSYRLFSALNYLVFEAIQKNEPQNILLKTELLPQSQTMEILRDGLPFFPSTLERLNANFMKGKELTKRPTYHGGTEMGYLLSQFGGTVYARNLSLDNPLSPAFSASYLVELPLDL